MSETGDILVLLALLQAKHFLGDFVFQSGFILHNRRQYGHPGGLLHVAIHGAGSLFVLLIAGPASTGVALAAIAVEIVVHYHIDWSKDQLTARLALTQEKSSYWWLMGGDQALHQLTYVVMVWYWASLA